MRARPRSATCRCSTTSAPALLCGRGSGVLGDEPVGARSVAAGADVVCFSGDKLLGGPQAGIVGGQAEAIERMRAHPLARAVRIDKLTWRRWRRRCGCTSTARAAEIRCCEMLAAGGRELEERPVRLLEELRPGAGGHAPCEWYGRRPAGGGSLPLVELPGPWSRAPPASGR